MQKVALALMGLVCLATPTFAGEVGGAGVPNTYNSRPSGGWVGYAVSNNGRVFVSDRTGSEPAVRAQARDECQTTTLVTCAPIAVQNQSRVVAVVCGQGSQRRGFIGGSNIDVGAAEYIAKDKARQAGYDSSYCSVVFRE